ncbi:unnamed protein product [Oncorhynchus mykiss]|uniref:ceramide glucosyltransferase n=1 Tax=Oncorhynchus mykiss TaxID=8022 RepID=A0A060Y2F1_ONCMY|nr:unnamed protein product [Oncorhynchus mykiss]
MPGYEGAKYDLVWICDSGIRVKPDTLTDMANQMTEKVGLVHGLPYVADRQGFAATLEQVGILTDRGSQFIFPPSLASSVLNSISKVRGKRTQGIIKKII